MTSRFTDKVAVVTGGSSGIGRAVCVALAAEGARLVVAGRDPAKLEETRAALPPGSARDGGALLFSGDVREPGDMERMAALALDSFGRIDILVCSAGIGSGTAIAGHGRSAVADLPAKVWDEIVDTNLKGTFLAIRAVLPAMMRRHGGEILNVSSSLGATSGWPYASAYCASKFALTGLTEAVAEEARPHGIRVQMVLPDAVDTPLLKASRLALMRALTPAQVAAFILEMLAAPEDTALLGPLIAPFEATLQPGRRSAFVK